MLQHDHSPQENGRRERLDRFQEGHIPFTIAHEFQAIKSGNLLDQATEGRNVI